MSLDHNSGVTSPDSDDYGGESSPYPPAPPAAKPAANPWSREALRVDNRAFADVVAVKTHQHSIPVDKPTAECWFRVHPDPEFSLQTYVLQLKDDHHRGTYLVSPDLWPHLTGNKSFRLVRLALCITRQDSLRIWPLRLPGPDGREDAAMVSALAVAEQAKSEWTQLFWRDGAYQSNTTDLELPEPNWPDRSFDELLDLAFRKSRIKSLDDPILRHLLRGS